MKRRAAFMLVDLVVVITIIGFLVGLLAPVTLAAKESARRTQCSNNLRQIAMAMQHFAAVHEVYPPSRDWNRKINDHSEAWSAQAKILPFVSENTAFKNANFRFGEKKSKFADGTPIRCLRVATYICPDELHDTALLVNGKPESYPLNYGLNMGTWLVYDPANDKGGQGCFYPNARLRPADITKGLSNTLMAAEVKAFTPFLHDAAAENVPPMPSSRAICHMGGIGEFGTNFTDSTGHADWSEGLVDQIGFTTTLAPNTFVACASTTQICDIDFTNMTEGRSTTAPTFAAVTSRSYHGRIVNASFMDGSTHTISDDIDVCVWQALSTRSGHGTATGLQDFQD